MVPSLPGRASSGTPAALQAAGGLAKLSYQRDDEESADLQGMALLVRAGISTDGLATFMRRLVKERPGIEYVVSTTTPAGMKQAER